MDTSFLCIGVGAVHCSGGRRVQSPTENVHEQGVEGSSVVGLPGWSESEAVPAGNTQATGTPRRQIWGSVAMGK